MSKQISPLLVLGEDPTNRGMFAPDPRKFERQANQEERNRQAKLAQGYTLKRVEYLQNQLHKAPYKRDFEYQNTDEAGMKELIKTAATARTIMLNSISEWAGTYDEGEMASALPNVWGHFVAEVRREAAAEVPVNTDETPATEAEAVPIQVINRPVIPEDAPKSTVEAPKQLTLGEVLGKIEQANAK